MDLWTEVGESIGSGTPNPLAADPYLFYAESRPSGLGYQEYFFGNVGRYDYLVSVSIQYNYGNSDYDVYVGNDHGVSGIGGTQAYPVVDLQTGSEVENDGALVRGESSGLEYFTNGGASVGWYNGPYNSHGYSLPSTYPGYAKWISYNNDIVQGSAASC